MALMVFNGLSNGMGGISWEGLPYLVEFYGIKDLEGLIHRLYIIRNHQPPNQG